MKKKINKKEFYILQGLAHLSRLHFEKAEEFKNEMLALLNIDKDSIGKEEECISDIMWNGDTLKRALEIMKIQVDISFTGNSSKKNDNKK